VIEMPGEYDFSACDSLLELLSVMVAIGRAEGFDIPKSIEHVLGGAGVSSEERQQIATTLSQLGYSADVVKAVRGEPNI
jgi:hypothetical protein